jgi:hypothetical protein
MQQPACFAPDSCDHDQHTTVLVQNVFREVAWLAITTHGNGDGSSTPIPGNSNLSSGRAEPSKAVSENSKRT